MAEFTAKWVWGLRSVWMLSLNFLLALVFVSAERRQLWLEDSRLDGTEGGPEYLLKAVNFLWQPDQSGYHHVWPEMEFGWKIVAGTIIGFCGAAFGSVGGVGGGGIFVPMLSLIIGFDPKSATAVSKCMIMGAAGSTVYYNLKLRHPTLDLPIIDYDLVLLIQPMLMLGISIGVAFNVVFADWMVTVLLIFLFIVTSTKAFFKGVETWKKETIMKKEAAKRLETNGSGGAEVEYKPLPGGPNNGTHKDSKEQEVSILENVYWKELGLLVFVWVAFLAIQITKNYTATCSTTYWALNLLQIPVSFGVSLYEAVGLYKGHRVIASKGDERTKWQVHQLVIYCFLGVVAGIVGGLLGLGGGFIMGPLFLELGIPPQVSSASATFGMTFSSSMSVVEYYLLKRFPVPYALYFVAVATIAAFIGQHIVRKLVNLLGRASLIIFILAFTIFVSAISLGGVGISNMIGKIQQHEYMGFENLCMFSTPHSQISMAAIERGKQSTNKCQSEMKFGWEIVVGTIIGICGAAFGSVGGGGGIFVPMLSLIIGFDPKSATAISKCMIMGAAFSTVYYDFKLRHPQLDMPVIDYDLVLLIQPMFMLGISIGVAFNVVFADWMVTVLLIFLFIVISTKAFFKGTETWKKETIMNRDAAKRLKSNDSGGAEVEYKSLPGGSNNGAQKDSRESEVTILDNVYRKQFGLLVFVWVAFLFLQIAKNYTATCSTTYWVLNLLQIPVSFGVSLYQAVGLYKGHRVIASRRDERTNWQVHQLVTYCSLGILAGIVGGLLGLGGGFIMAPLFLELGIPPQVSSATANFGMTFSSSMSVVEYYLLKRFPVPYALYIVAVSIVAAFIGQHIVRKLVNLFGRASLIIFILAFTIFISAISLGGVGISNMIGKIHRHEYMGFENLCKYDA